MRVIDLSHPIAAGMPAYPGDPQVEVRPLADPAARGYATLHVGLTTHSGTHMDAPAHMIAGGAALDQLPLSRCLGPGLMLDVRHAAGRALQPEDIAPALADAPAGGFLLLRTGWDEFWGYAEYFTGHPHLSAAAAAALARSPLAGLGLDCPSPDAADSVAWPAHKTLLAAGKTLVENLRGLHALPERGFLFLALPLPLAGADGAPCRAAALLEPCGGQGS